MGKVAYFVMGNVWLLVAVVLWLGRNVDRGETVRYSFFGVGGPHSPLAYQGLIVISLLLGLVFLLVGRSRHEDEE